MILRCTVKLLKLLGVTTRSLDELDPDDDDWYANLLSRLEERYEEFRRAG